MLNKEICKKCWLEWGNVNDEKSFEYQWSEGWVWCANINSEDEAGYVKTKGNTPKYCPYILEHVVESK